MPRLLTLAPLGSGLAASLAALALSGPAVAAPCPSAAPAPAPARACAVHTERHAPVARHGAHHRRTFRVSHTPQAARVAVISAKRTAPSKTRMTQTANTDAPAPVVPSMPSFFSPTSIWNAALPADAPLDANSPTVVGNLLSQESSEAVGVASTSYGAPIYTVGADQPTVAVSLTPANAILQPALTAVPLPPEAVPAAGTDGNLAVYQPSTDTMWEFWRLSKNATGGWQAAWGGRMTHVSQDPGYYRNISDPSGSMIERNNWGAPATSFPLVAGVMTLSELESGQINHALALAVGNSRAGAWAWPAQRSDGASTDPTTVPEGAHFRLDPNLDLSTLNLPPLVHMMAVAAQKYGIIITNRSAGLAFRGEDPTQFEATNGYNPYMGPANTPGTPGALFDQWPTHEMRLFPWSHLQLLNMNLQTQRDTTVLSSSNLWSQS